MNRLTAFLCLLLWGCLPIDDQSIATPEMKVFANPAPTSDGRTNNAHRALIAIIDSGTDYNHPLLSSKIHWTLDAGGKIVGTGWDYIGKDAWPAPFIVRTAHLRAGLSARKRAKEEKEQDRWTTGIQRVLEAAPDLAKYIHPLEALTQEDEQGIYHGTHVAGLASYDDARIGILPFRILPQTDAPGIPDANVDLFKNIEDAVARAKASGAKIVSMSIGMTFDKEDKEYQKLKPLFDRFRAFVKANDDLVFVAAAGNDGKWLDGKKHLSMPCGIEADNLLCVASLDPSGDPSSFSNIPLLSSPLVFAPGEKIYSTMPTQYCKTGAKNSLNQLGDGYLEETYPAKSGAEIEALRTTNVNNAVRALRADCGKKDQTLDALSGSLNEERIDPARKLFRTSWAALRSRNSVASKFIASALRNRAGIHRMREHFSRRFLSLKSLWILSCPLFRPTRSTERLESFPNPNAR